MRSTGLRSGGQRHERDTAGHLQGGRAVPARTVEEQGDVIRLGDGLGEVIEEQLHRPGVDLREDQGEGVVSLHLGGSEDVGEGEALVGGARRTLPFQVPAMAYAAFLADARLVLKEDAQPLIGTLTDDFPRDVWSPL